MLTRHRAGRLYLRTHRAPATAAAALAVAIGTWAVGTLGVPVAPAGAAMTYPAPLWVYLPAVTALVISACAVGTQPVAEQMAARALSWVTAAYLTVTTAAAALLTGAVLVADGGPDLAGAAARNLLAWTGLALVAGWVLTPATSWVAPLAWVFVVEWFGKTPDGIAQPWTIVRAPGGDPLSWIVAAVLFTTGVWLTCRPSRRTALRAAAPRDRG
ncbi:hypothetical protein [Cellulomonas hominis]